MWRHRVNEIQIKIYFTFRESPSGFPTVSGMHSLFPLFAPITLPKLHVLRKVCACLKKKKVNRKNKYYRQHFMEGWISNRLQNQFTTRCARVEASHSRWSMEPEPEAWDADKSVTKKNGRPLYSPRHLKHMSESTNNRNVMKISDWGNTCLRKADDNQLLIGTKAVCLC